MPPGASPRRRSPVPPRAPSPPSVARTNAKNPLNFYRSYNYVFTLAALKSRALDDPDSYKNNQDYFVIAKSGGKGFSGIQVPNSGNSQGTGNAPKKDAQTQQLADPALFLQGFNSQSPGRFDFFIDNVRIETIVGGGETSNMSIATKIEFDVFEPYSMTGFIEALQASAVAAGHVNYIQCPYLLKMEFRGYRDSEDGDPIKVPDSTRYFVMGFTGLDIDVTESGARYSCKCVPFNEKAFGEPSVLKQDVKMKGATVHDILYSFLTGVNQSLIEDAKSATNVEDRNKYDTYQIVFPKITSTGVDTSYLTDRNYQKNTVGTSTVLELLKDQSVYQFPDPGEEDKGPNIKYDPKDPVIHFAKGADIHDCIVSIVRDSTYTRNILQNFSPDDRGMVKYFMIHVESHKKGIRDEKANRDFYIYRYIVIEYDIHYTRIQPRPNKTVDTSKIKQSVVREYNYLYTGANVDIKKFNLKFNTLFFQAIPRAMGNKPTLPSADRSVESPNPPAAGLAQNSDNSSPLGAPPIMSSVSRNQPTMSGLQNATFPQNDPYTDLARGMHQAILENVDQCSAEIEIYGDPYYLVTAGSGNQKLALNANNTAGEGEAPVYTGDVHILIMFRNPVDIDADTGFAFFDNRVALYSGVFRVLSIESKFKDGEFSQRLNLIRIPGQLEDTNVQPETAPQNPVASEPNPTKSSVPEPPPVPTTVKATEDSLMAQIAAGLPLAGLPNELSNLIPGNLGSLVGSTPGRTAIGSLVNSVSSLVSGASNAVGSLVNQVSGPIADGLSNVSSALRLADAGLSALSTKINSAGGAVNQLSATANSVGLKNVTPTNLGKEILAVGASNAAAVGQTAMSAVGSLGSKAAGLVSESASKVDAIKGQADALAAQLGITPSSLSGLSENLQASIVKQIAEAAQNIPTDVDITSAIDKGLIFNNIPISALKNIPSTQPDATAPLPKLNLSDVKFIIEKGGVLANLPGAAEIPGISEVLNAVPTPSLVQNASLDTKTIADKVSTIQAGLTRVTGNSLSVEAALNTVAAVVPSGVPNVSDVTSSVINKFGSSSVQNSPLANLIKNNSLG